MRLLRLVCQPGREDKRADGADLQGKRAILIREHERLPVDRNRRAVSVGDADFEDLLHLLRGERLAQLPAHDGGRNLVRDGCALQMQKPGLRRNDFQLQRLHGLVAVRRVLLRRPAMDLHFRLNRPRALRRVVGQNKRRLAPGIRKLHFLAVAAGGPDPRHLALVEARQGGRSPGDLHGVSGVVPAHIRRQYQRRGRLVHGEMCTALKMIDSLRGSQRYLILARRPQRGKLDEIHAAGHLVLLQRIRHAVAGDLHLQIHFIQPHGLLQLTRQVEAGFGRDPARGAGNVQIVAVGNQNPEAAGLVDRERNRRDGLVARGDVLPVAQHRALDVNRPLARGGFVVGQRQIQVQGGVVHPALVEQAPHALRVERGDPQEPDRIVDPLPGQADRHRFAGAGLLVGGIFRRNGDLDRRRRLRNAYALGRVFPGEDIELLALSQAHVKFIRAHAARIIGNRPRIRVSLDAAVGVVPVKIHPRIVLQDRPHLDNVRPGAALHRVADVGISLGDICIGAIGRLVVHRDGNFNGNNLEVDIQRFIERIQVDSRGGFSFQRGGIILLNRSELPRYVCLEFCFIRIIGRDSAAGSKGGTHSHGLLICIGQGSLFEGEHHALPGHAWSRVNPCYGYWRRGFCNEHGSLAVKGIDGTALPCVGRDHIFARVRERERCGIFLIYQIARIHRKGLAVAGDGKAHAVFKGIPCQQIRVFHGERDRARGLEILPVRPLDAHFKDRRPQHRDLRGDSRLIIIAYIFPVLDDGNFHHEGSLARAYFSGQRAFQGELPVQGKGDVVLPENA